LINSKTIVENREVYFISPKKGFIVSVEIFKTPDEYIVFASSNLTQHDDLVGMASHENKEQCTTLALKELHKLMEE
jgi:hypothetical protein